MGKKLQVWQRICIFLCKITIQSNGRKVVGN